MQGHFVKTVRLWTPFLQKIIYIYTYIYICIYIYSCFPPKHPTLCTLSPVLSANSLWILLAFRTGVAHCVDTPSQKALPQLFWVVCSAVFTVDATAPHPVLLGFCFCCVASTLYVGGLVSYCCCNKSRQIQWLKTTPRIYLTGVEQTSRYVRLNWFSLESYKAEVKVMSGLWSFLEVLGTNVLPISCGLLAKSSPMWLFYWGACFLAGCQQGHP